ncbi:serine hydrolase [Altererythrobacter xixiisoli]|uniref:serine-type D-Ala-D-Ala carboxypeptidase n=2 Tax=Croceibacterium xixiisoli TaxID=1476466 RepID=A0A6I4TUU6_9SPHN|nr:serine hydrolase [Croceibacterium xixiisoli]
MTENAGAAPVDPAIPVALLIDLASGQTLYSRDPERRFVPASVTKVMTAYSAFGLIADGKLSPDTPVTISKDIADKWYGEGSNMFLRAGETVSVEQLLMGITTVSANDASVVLGTMAAGSLDGWLAMMNANAAQLGMRDTHFGTPNGWPDEGRTFTSARDLARLAEAMTARYPELYRQYFGHPGMRYRDITQVNHDPVTGVVPGADGIKTGYTRQAGYNFVGSGERNGRRLIMVLAGAPTARMRDQSARALLSWGFDAFQPRVILQADMPVGMARVQSGAKTSVALRTESEVLASLPGGNSDQLKLSVRYRGPIEAPIAKGQKVAVLRVEIPGQLPHDVPLVASEEVARANAWQRFRNGVTGLFS